MIPFTINISGEKKVVQFPSSYSDLKFGQFLRIRFDYDGDLLLLLEILSGVPRDTWAKMDASLENAIIPYLSWVMEPFKWDELPLPESIEIAGVTVPIPKDLGHKSFGQKIITETKIIDAVKEKADLVSVMADVIATYFQPEIDKCDFDESKVERIKIALKHCRAVDVYPIGSFFLRKSSVLLLSGKAPSLKTETERTAHNKSEQVLHKSKGSQATF